MSRAKAKRAEAPERVVLGEGWPFVMERSVELYPPRSEGVGVARTLKRLPRSIAEDDDARYRLVLERVEPEPCDHWNCAHCLECGGTGRAPRAARLRKARRSRG